MIRKYHCLNKQEYSLNNYKIIPIRNADRYRILKWRNDQMYHLRQNKILSKDDQDKYFKDIISQIFKEKNPNQILFSFLKNEECIGYGGLVHINWDKLRAEISFIMNTELEKSNFLNYWSIFLTLIEDVAFNNLNFIKIYTSSYNIRPKLYNVLDSKQYILEETISKSKKITGFYYDTLVHSKYSPKISYRNASLKDMNIVFEWANEETNRLNSLSNRKIGWIEHKNWYEKKIKEKNIFIFYNIKPIGVVRLEKSNRMIKISFSIDKDFRGYGYGYFMINKIIRDNKNKCFYAEVKKENIPSQRIFIKNNFKSINYKNNSEIFTYEKC